MYSNSLTPEQYLDEILSLPYILDELPPQVSRDGHWVAWTWYNAGSKADVFAVLSDGSVEPIRLTDTSDETVLVSWLPDSSGVIVAQDKDGNERVQLFRIDLENPLEMIPLTEPSPNYYIHGGQLHPNKRWLVYAANLDLESAQEIEPTRIYRHDLLTGQRLLLAKPEKAAPVIPELNPQGTHILYSRKDRHPAGRQIWLVDIEGREDREIINPGAEKKASARWTPDGRKAIILAETKTHRRLGIWDLQDNSLIWLIDDPQRDIQEAYVPHGSHDIVVVENQRGRIRSSLLSIQNLQESPLPQQPGNFIPLAPVQEQAWLGFYYSSQQPADIVRFELKNPNHENFISLTRVWERTPLTDHDFASAQDFLWDSVDDMQIHGWLYQPKKPAKGTIIYVHGGPTWHSQDWINPEIQFYVRSGFNVLDPNYRGSTGYGLIFCDAIKEDGWGGREQIDIRTGVEALISAGIAQPGRVGITGTSYGGYSSWFAITHFDPQVISAAAPVCGMTDLVVDYETTRPDIRPYSEEMMGGSPIQVPERYYERSPINHIEKIRGQLLIVQGAQDPNVTPENVRVVEAELKRANKTYQLITFQDEGHGIGKPNNQKTLYLRLSQFFSKAFTNP